MIGRDEIIDEIRAVRDAYCAQFDYDIARIVEDLRAREKANNRKMANLKPVKPRPRHPASR